MSGKRKKTKVRKPLLLPKDIRNELRMTCAIKGYSEMKSGKPRNTSQQRIRIAEFYHGKPPNRPSQIKLLAEAHLNYRDLYDEISSTAISKNSDESTITKYKLKSKLSLDISRQYISGYDINSNDLEKQFRQGDQLLSGRSILEMAQKGLKHYKKALAFAAHKWDDVQMTPKYTGDSEADVIEYVRTSMYKLLEWKKNDEQIESDKSEEEDFVDIDVEANGTNTVNQNTATDNAVTTEANSTSNNDDIVTNDAVTVTTTTGGNDTDKNNGDDSIDSNDSTDSNISVPADYMFPSFFVFLTWGPFVSPDDRLSSTLITDIDKKKGTGTRSELRNQLKMEKKEDATCDNTGLRGFSTDQRIEIENLNIRKKQLANQVREQRVVGLAIEQDGITRQIEIAERRAKMICSDYDEDNVHWKRVESLLKEQDAVLKRIRDFNEQKTSDAPIVTDFINKPSPEKDTGIMNRTITIDESSSISPEVASIQDDLVSKENVDANKDTSSKRKASSNETEKRRVRTRRKNK